MNVLDTARWFCATYFREYHVRIDEMKLHKLLYLSQRESFVRSETPLFENQFQAWKYGPVMTEVRDAYHNGALFDNTRAIPTQPCEELILNYVFNTYAAKDSWSLSRLTHAEYSWSHAREGLNEGDHSDRYISNDDIREDAERIKYRRGLLMSLGVK